MVPQSDVDIYDGESIDGSIEAKSKNNWLQIFDMIDLTFNNLQQQNKELKRTVNELSSKVNKVIWVILMETFWQLFVLSDGISREKRRKQNSSRSVKTQESQW